VSFFCERRTKMGAEETKGTSSNMHSFSFTQMIDLSVGIIPDAPHEPWKPSIRYLTHEREGLDWIKTTFGAKEEDLIHSGGKGAAFEEVTAITHAGTHVDAPWHYAPQSEGKPAKKIDELPIEWFFSDGVVLHSAGARSTPVSTRGCLAHASQELIGHSPRNCCFSKLLFATGTIMRNQSRLHPKFILDSFEIHRPMLY